MTKAMIHPEHKWEEGKTCWRTRKFVKRASEEFYGPSGSRGVDATSSEGWSVRGSGNALESLIVVVAPTASNNSSNAVFTSIATEAIIVQNELPQFGVQVSLWIWVLHRFKKGHIPTPPKRASLPPKKACPKLERGSGVDCVWLNASTDQVELWMSKRQASFKVLFPAGKASPPKIKRRGLPAEKSKDWEVS